MNSKEHCAMKSLHNVFWNIKFDQDILFFDALSLNLDPWLCRYIDREVHVLLYDDVRRFNRLMQLPGNWSIVDETD